MEVRPRARGAGGSNPVQRGPRGVAARLSHLDEEYGGTLMRLLYAEGIIPFAAKNGHHSGAQWGVAGGGGGAPAAE